MNTGTVVDDIFMNKGFVEDPPVVLLDDVDVDVDVDDAFYEGYYEGHTDDGINIREKMSGLLFCLCILATGFYILYAYKKDKREEEKEEIRRLRETRIEAEVEKAKEKESKRTEIAEVLKGYGISMKSLIQSSMNVDIDDSNMDVVNLTGKTTSSTVLVMDDDDSEIIDIKVPMVESKKKTNLLIYDKDDNENKNENENEHKQVYNNVPPIKIHIPVSKLLKAASDDLCAICLDVFELDNNIIFCSNNKSHCFHQECSLDYLLSHTEGVQAPCPLCRKPFLCSSNDNNNSIEVVEEDETEGGDTGEEEADAGISISSHPSSVSRSDLLKVAVLETEISSPV